MTAGEKSPPIPELLLSPLGYSKGVLRLNSYQWAERILMDLDEPGAIAVRACNGAGKTTHLAAPAALWHATVFPGSLCVITSGTYRQVKEQLFPALHKHAHKFRGWKFLESEVETHHGSRIIGFSSDEPGRAEGWHADNLLFIIDEAKTVPDSIFSAMERCQPNRKLIISSPGGTEGEFYHAFHSRRKHYRTHTITANECPHITKQWIDEQIEKYGEHHPLVKSMIFAEFMTSGEDGTVIPLSSIEALFANPPELSGEGYYRQTQAFCDFAAGGDENVLAIRRENKVVIAAAWRDRDTMRATGRFITLFKEHNLRPDEIAGDDGGLGHVICDALREAGWPIMRINNGSAAQKPDHYVNKAAEIWHEGARKIERRQVILPDDQALIGQLSSRKGWPDSKGRLTLESKQDMRARGIPSPDRADAVLGAIHDSYYKPLLFA